MWVQRESRDETCRTRCSLSPQMFNALVMRMFKQLPWVTLTRWRFRRAWSKPSLADITRICTSRPPSDGAKLPFRPKTPSHWQCSQFSHCWLSKTVFSLSNSRRSPSSTNKTKSKGIFRAKQSQRAQLSMSLAESNKLSLAKCNLVATNVGKVNQIATRFTFLTTRLLNQNLLAPRFCKGLQICNSNLWMLRKSMQARHFTLHRTEYSSSRSSTVSS